MSISISISILLSYALALVAMAFYTLLERKYLGYFQLRKGPNKVGLTGIPQPFADAMKLFFKERSSPTSANKAPFMLAPLMGLVLALMMWAIYPHSNSSFYIMYGVLYFLCVSSMNIYSVFISGWSSNSKYALLGALRGVAQTISYEVSMSLILLSALIIMSSVDFSMMSASTRTWVALLMMPLFLMWFVTNLAETNRTPFDFAEGESELVSGFNIEYSGGLFALIFMAEYTNILVMSLFTAVIFMSTPLQMNFFLLTQTMILASMFILIRATLPRMRYDHLMALTWKSFLPFALSAIILVTSTMSMWCCAGRTDNSDDVKHE